MADILFSDVTNATTSTDGTGFFDEIMKSSLLHIKKEYDEGRIKGPDYANVYLGTIQSAMSQAVQFALQEKITEAQIDATAADTAIKQAQSAKDLEVKTEQITASVASTLRNDVQSTKDLLVKDKDIAVKTQQISSMVVEDGIKSAQSTKDLEVKTQQITSMGIDDSLKTAQKAEVSAGTIREDLKNTSEIELKAAQTLLVGKQDLTEVQKALLVTRQIKGFQDDKSVKIFKAQLDAKSVVYSVAPSELTVPTYTYTEVLT